MAAHFQLGALRAEAKRYESAARHLQKSVQHPDFTMGSRLLLGESYLALGRTQEAAVEYLEALKLGDVEVVPAEQADGLRQLYDPLVEAQAHETDDQKNKQLCDNIVDVLMRENWRKYLRGLRGQSITPQEGPPTPLAETLTEARSSYVVVAMNDVRELARKGQRYAAIEEAYYALEQAPTYLPMHVMIGDLLLGMDMVPEAIEKFTVIARSYRSRGEAGRAIEMFRRVVNLSPMDLAAREQLIEQLIARGTSEDAIQEYIQLAEVHYSLADLTNARKTLAKAMRLSQISDVGPAWQVRVLHRVADIDVQSLDWREAARVYHEIMTLKPDDGKACANLLDLNFRLGEHDKAVKSLDNFLKYLNAKQRMVEAIQFLEKQLEEHPQQAALHRRIAEEYHLVGNQEQAIRHLDRAGEILLDAGDSIGAIAAIQRIIDLNPPNVEEYRQMIETL